MFSNLRLISQIGAAFALTLAGMASAQNTVEAEAFAQEAIAKLKTALPEANYASEPGDPLQINITNHPRSDEATINLHRVFNLCQSITASECEERVAQLISVMTQELPAFAPSDLRIIVRDAQYWDYIATNFADRLPPHRKIGEDLYAILAVDSAQSISVAAPGVLDELGVAPDRAWQLGVKQTETIHSLPKASDYQSHVFAFEGTEYMASMLFDLVRWGEIAREVGPDLMISATSDQFVFSAIIPEDDALTSMREAAAGDCAEAPRCVSPHIYRFRDGMWMIAD